MESGKGFLNKKEILSWMSLKMGCVTLVPSYINAKNTQCWDSQFLCSFQLSKYQIGLWLQYSPSLYSQKCEWHFNYPSKNLTCLMLHLSLVEEQEFKNNFGGGSGVKGKEMQTRLLPNDYFLNDIICNRGCQAFPIKNQRVNILSFLGHKVSATTTQLC